LDRETPIGFIRYEGYDFDGVAMVESDQTIAITGAYVRLAYRGKKAAVAMLNTTLRDCADRGLTCCAVNFESFNPEAAAFWMKYFKPVGLSVMRVPEALP
jgi:GNAT superfamily N-acetyltransferase